MRKLLRSALTENLGSKIIAVVLGLVVWLHVNQQLHPLEKEAVMAEVSVKNVAEDLVSRLTPGELRVTLRGDKEEIQRLRPYLRDLEAVVDAAGREAGVHNVTPELVGLPPGVRLTGTNVFPATVQLRLQRRASKRVSVSLVFTSPPPEGMEVGEPLIRPREVLLEGAQDELSAIATAQVEIDLASVEKRNTLGLPVHLYNAQGNRVRNPGISIEPSLVSVTVPIKGLRTKVVPVVPQLEKQGEGFDIEAIDVSPAAVTLTGENETLEQILHVPTETMTITGQRERESRRLGLLLPPKVRAIGTAEVQVTVSIRRLPPPVPEPEPGGEKGTAKGKVPSEP